MPEFFPMAPVGAKGMMWLWGIAGVVTLLAVFMLWLALSAGRVRVELGPGELTIRGALSTRVIPVGDLIVEEARVVDLGAEPSLRPRWRTFGTAVPGYSSGWFRLRDGQKALTFLTRTDRILYAPTRQGYALLISVAEPERLAEALRGRAAVGR